MFFFSVASYVVSFVLWSCLWLVSLIQLFANWKNFVERLSCTLHVGLRYIIVFVTAIDVDVCLATFRT